MSWGPSNGHVPHPRISERAASGPVTTRRGLNGGAVRRFNTALGVRITAVVGTMWCAYVFTALALISLPAAVNGGVNTLVSWVAQTFLQLVLLSVIMVGQNVQADASDRRAQSTWDDTEALLDLADKITARLAAAYELLTEIDRKLLAIQSPERDLAG